MKSKKAERYIFEHKHFVMDMAEEDCAITDLDAEVAVDFAEHEATEKHQKEMADYKEAVIDAHRLGCPELPITKKMCYADALNIHQCNDECHYMKYFKELIKNI